MTLANRIREFDFTEHQLDTTIQALEDLLQEYNDGIHKVDYTCKLCHSSQAVFNDFIDTVGIPSSLSTMSLYNYTNTYCIVCPWVVITKEDCFSSNKLTQLDQSDNTSDPTAVKNRIKQLKRWIQAYKDVKDREKK